MAAKSNNFYEHSNICEHKYDQFRTNESLCKSYVQSKCRPRIMT